MSGDEVLFEFRPVGNAVRVCAIHVATNTEIVIVGPATAPPEVLKRTALQKLAFVLNKKKEEKR